MKQVNKVPVSLLDSTAVPEPTAPAATQFEGMAEEEDWEVMEEAGGRLRVTPADGLGEDGASRGVGGGVVVQEGMVEVLETDTLGLVSLEVMLMLFVVVAATLITGVSGAGAAAAATEVVAVVSLVSSPFALSVFFSITLLRCFSRNTWL